MMSQKQPDISGYIVGKPHEVSGGAPNEGLEIPTSTARGKRVRRSSEQAAADELKAVQAKVRLLESRMPIRRVARIHAARRLVSSAIQGLLPGDASGDTLESMRMAITQLDAELKLRGGE